MAEKTIICETRLRPGYGQAYRKLRDLLLSCESVECEILAGRFTVSVHFGSSINQCEEIEEALTNFLCEYSTKAGAVLQTGPSEREFRVVGKTLESCREVWQEYCKEQMYFWERKISEIDGVMANQASVEVD